MTVALTGGVGVGSTLPDVPPSGFSSMAAFLAERAPQEMRERLAGGLERYCNALMAALDNPYSRGHAKALDVYPRIMRAIGAEQDLVRAFLAGMGLSTVAELEARVSTARTLDTLDGADADAQGIAYFRRRMRSDPTMRDRLRRELFGEVGESGAVVVDANGPETHEDALGSPNAPEVVRVHESATLAPQNRT